jgi:hypothetical protein
LFILVIYLFVNLFMYRGYLRIQEVSLSIAINCKSLMTANIG